ncbi:fasciclin domain-containing protein [Massilia sp. S19_KUP03_FR1]|uniref:fasciclin domain-containing protein n=1 Tax=Massilia sp. S19_KUP03_FR1 TaxID=3025503 RepID=UPI002FCD2F5B
MKFLRHVFAILFVAGLSSSCGGGDDDFGNLATVAQQRGFTALLAASDKAGITATLQAENANVTVFAPTNAAFDTLAKQLGFANAGELVTALPASDLSKILQYHVVSGTKSAADLRAAGASLQTSYRFEGAPATVRLKTGTGIAVTDAVLADATVTTADVRADNGVIHAVDKVLVPPGVLNVVQMAQANPATFSSLVGAVVATGLAPTLSGAGPFTVFAPVNTAFAAAPQGLTTAQLTSVLTYHVLSGQVLSSAIPFGTPIATLDTKTLDGATVAAQTITINSNLTITDTTTSAASILATDVRAVNGVIHVIGKVLIPR